jgi:hypothetical protein
VRLPDGYDRLHATGARSPSIGEPPHHGTHATTLKRVRSGSPERKARRKGGLARFLVLAGRAMLSLSRWGILEVSTNTQSAPRRSNRTPTWTREPHADQRDSQPGSQPAGRP